MPKTNKNEETTSELRYCPVCRTYRNWWEMIEDNKCIYCLTDEIIILAGFDEWLASQPVEYPEPSDFEVK